MDLISILATVIWVTTIGTMVIGVGAFAAFKLRDKRKPSKAKSGVLQNPAGVPDPIFLKPYLPPELEKAALELE